MALLPLDRFNSIDKIEKVKAPLLILHSQDDDVILLRHGQLLFEKARENKQLHVFEQGGHLGMFWEKEYSVVMEKFLFTQGLITSCLKQINIFLLKIISAHLITASSASD